MKKTDLNRIILFLSHITDNKTHDNKQKEETYLARAGSVSLWNKQKYTVSILVLFYSDNRTQNTASLRKRNKNIKNSFYLARTGSVSLFNLEISI